MLYIVLNICDCSVKNFHLASLSLVFLDAIVVFTNTPHFQGPYRAS